MAMADHFRVDSSAFKDIPWRTNILHVAGGLDELETIPILTVSTIPTLVSFRY